MEKELFTAKLSKISYQNKLNIMRELLCATPTSRKEVAKKCALSEVTVGKVCSALCERGFLRAEKRPMGRGRHTDFFSPSDIVCALVISVRADSLSATLFELSEYPVFEFCRTLSSALSYEAFANDFCLELFAHISQTCKGRFFKTAIIFSSQVSTKEREIFKSAALAYFETDAQLEYESAKAHSLCKLYPNSVLLEVEVRERVTVSIICGDRVLPKGCLCAVRLPSNDPTLLIEQIADLVCPLFEAVLPDRIIIDSQTLLADRSFCASLRETLARRMRASAEDIPQIESNRNADFAEREALEFIREHICIALASDS